MTKTNSYTIHNLLTTYAPDGENFHDLIIQKIIKSDIEYGGFTTKDLLVEKIHNFVDTDGSNLYSKQQADNINEIIHNTMEKTIKTLPNSNLVNIFVIPTNSEFLKEYMAGIVGWCPSSNAIHLFIHPDCNISVDLIETIVHEYNHTVFRSHHYWNSVQDGLVAEGLAEHFREHLVGGKRAKWTTVLSKKEAYKWLKKLKPILKSEESDDYTNVFTNFDEDPYPLWTGYSLGYYLIQDYILKHNQSWDDLMSIQVETIMLDFNY